jgi:hypothetical protein
VAVASEALEGFGGAGYVEDTGLPVFLRDAQVLPIWEGTTNVLSLDVLRSIAREEALSCWAADARRRLQALEAGPLSEMASELRRRADEVETRVARIAAVGTDLTEASARAVALSLAGLAAAVPLAEQGAWALASGRGGRSALVARRWIERLSSIPHPQPAKVDDDRLLSRLGD